MINVFHCLLEAGSVCMLFEERLCCVVLGLVLFIIDDQCCLLRKCVFFLQEGLTLLARRDC
jgi:hypothetical protein